MLHKGKSNNNVTNNKVEHLVPLQIKANIGETNNGIFSRHPCKTTGTR